MSERSDVSKIFHEEALGNKMVTRVSWSVMTGTKVAMSSVYATTSRTEGTERKATSKPRSFALMMSARERNWISMKHCID